MKWNVSRRGRIAAALTAALAAGAVSSASASAAPLLATATSGVTSVDTSACVDPLMSQPFVSVKDNNFYTLIGGETASGITGEGWTLSGGASIVTDATGASAVDLPSGSYAVSPAVCVTSAYPTARAVVKNVTGAEGIQFYVSYQGTPTWTAPKSTGQLHGTGSAWSLSTPINLQPANSTAWQIVRFVFVPGGKSSDFQLSQFWVDPRMH